jgi:hypothetical protein
LKARNKEAKYFEAELTRLSAGDPKILERLVRRGSTSPTSGPRISPKLPSKSRASPQSLWELTVVCARLSISSVLQFSAILGKVGEGSSMVRVTTVHMEGGENHEHIARVRWTNPQTGDSGQSTREQMIEYLRKPGTRAFVTDGERTVNIRIVEAEPPYIRTHADGVWTNNLLALPRYGPM